MQIKAVSCWLSSFISTLWKAWAASRDEKISDPAKLSITWDRSGVGKASGTTHLTCLN